MKNQVYISVTAIVVSCVLGLLFYTTGSNAENNGVIYDFSDKELVAAKDECKEIGLENDMQGDELNIFVYECFVNTIAAIDESRNQFEFTEDERDVSALEDERPAEFDDPDDGSEEPSYSVG